MALVIADRVRETTTTTGTGTLTLAGPYTGFQAFSVIGNGNTTYYAIIDASTGAWEVGIGTYTSSGNLLSRDTILASSNSGSAVNFSAGTKDVIITQPAERAVFAQSNGSGLQAGVAAFTANGVPYAASTSTLATGSGLTFDGTTLSASNISTAGSTTLSGGTANGVAYLNGSKVLTTGSALTFDGTSLFVGATSAAAGKLVVKDTASSNTLWLVGRTSDGASSVSFRNAADSAYNARLEGVSGQLAFEVNGSEQMRLTSTGLGIGTSSPGCKLDVAGSASQLFRINSTNASGGGLTVQTSGADIGYFGAAKWIYGGSYSANDLIVYAANNMSFGTNSTERMLLNSSGNLELKGKLAAGYSDFSGIPTNGAAFAGSVGIGTSSPATKLHLSDATNPTIRLQDTTYTGRYIDIAYNQNGVGEPDLVISRAVGGSPSTLATLNYNGNLGLGVTPSAWGGSQKGFQLGNFASVWTDENGATASIGSNVYQSANSTWRYVFSGVPASRYTQGGNHAWFIAASGTAGDAITFTQAMTLDASGNLALGTTSTAGRMHIAVPFSGSTATSLGDVSKSHIHLGDPGYNNQYCQITFGYDTTNAAAAIGFVSTSATGSTKGDLVFATRDVTTSTLPTERARITSGGVLDLATGAGAVGQIQFPATQVASSNANTLDDYEEGTWTPVATAATAPTGVTYNYQGGWYRKIGSLVVAGFGINIASVGTGGSGELKISGFPFTSATNGSYKEPTASLQGGNWVTSALAGQTYFFIADASTVAGTRYQNNSDTIIPWSDVQGGSPGTYFNGVLCYYIA